MQILMRTDHEGGTAVLTTESSQSHDGRPVLELTGEGVGGTFGPADLVFLQPNPRTAASIVAGWAQQKGRTVVELELARRFLGQWPEGPQV